MPFFGKDITVGLELSGAVLRAVRIEHAQHRPRVLALEKEHFPADSSAAFGMADSLWRAVKQGRKNHPVVVNLPGWSVQIKKIQVETAELEYVNDWVRWEAQQYLSGPAEDYILDFQKLRSREKGLSDILLVIAPADLVRNRMEVFRKAGVQPAVMDVDALALQNAFETNYQDILDRPVVLINVEQDSCTMVATEGGIPEDVITFQLDRQDLSLCERLRTSISHFQDKLRPEGDAPNTVGRALVSGGGSDLRVVADFLSSQCDMDVEFADPFRELAIGPSLRDKLLQAYRPEEFMLVTGLALRRT